jgi:hypothetical protein
MKRSSAHRRKQQRQLKNIKETRYTGLLVLVLWAVVAVLA